MPLSPEDVRALVAAFDGADWDEMTLTIDGTQLVAEPHRPPADRRRVRYRHAVGGPPARPPRRPPQAWRAGAVPAVRRPPPPHAACRAAFRPAATPPAAQVPSRRRGSAAPRAPAASPAAVTGHRVTAPSVGLFWRVARAGRAALRRGRRRVGPDDTVAHRRGDEADEPRRAPAWRARCGDRARRTAQTVEYGRSARSSSTRRLTMMALAPRARRQPRRDRGAHRPGLLRRGHRDGRSPCPRPTAAASAPRSPTARSCIGPASAAESYLDVDRRWSPPRLATGCDAVHPGYGFLVRAARAGPGLRRGTGSRSSARPPTRCARGGDKATARALAASLGIPIGAGSDVARQRRERAPRGRRRGRLPGRCSRRRRAAAAAACAWSTSPPTLAGAFEAQPSGEARQAFGDGRLFLERFVAPRPPRGGPGARPTRTAASSTSATATARSSAATRSWSRRRPRWRSVPLEVARPLRGRGRR